MNTKHGRLLRAVAVSVVAALALAACGGSDGDKSSSTGGAADVKAALKKGGTITVWAWEPTLTKVVKDFEAEHKNVTVKLVNAGTGNDQYTALQNAIKAGKGVPDVAQIEYYALPQFSLAKSVTDVSSYGASGLDKTFTPGPWASVQQAGGIYGLPMDSGPMALFYNKTVFDKYGVAVPKTWDEYVDAARKIHKADPKAYIANDAGDAGFTTSLIWQAGGQPFKVDGDKVKIDLSDAGSKRFADTWQKLLDEKLLAPTPSWSDGWYKGLADGNIATLTIGAWMPANLESGVKAGAGKWRVAPMPQWDAGANATSENGGSSLAIPTASKNKALAYAFMDYATAGQGAQTRVDAGAFPATTKQISDPAFVDKKSAYFGGQEINKVLAASAADVVKGWSYLPFQVYANSIFNDTVGKAYVSKTSLADGLADWQKKSASYGDQQGFTVN
ncbi:ABC transporter substrate-binding protein [Aeromicrobium ginsengisoli]|uniref:Sugar ABC transporter substrate-binding protein n=1 Tax=Aeromicrobium ginsengisoli TaxID=363867 RepID=A0A5M4FHW7_9ACTN|nr:sugar ABC transporter substrate-binding protein [Aeromicrobium ginsengisoli]KAA1399205.1 sugar ABC transporter substrate-binding protein [Aeromicrobium ginsengisoli]